MAIITRRAGLGRNLKADEVDANFLSLKNDVDAVSGIGANVTANTNDISTLNSQYSALNNSVSTLAGNTSTALGTKQGTLVSASNIKTINGATILGSGDLSIASGITALSAASDVSSINLPTTNTPLASALAAKADVLAPVALGTGAVTLTGPLHAFRHCSSTATADTTYPMSTVGAVVGMTMEVTHDGTPGTILTFGAATPAANKKNTIGVNETFTAVFSGGAWKSDTNAPTSSLTSVSTSSTCTSDAVLTLNSTTYGSDQTTKLQAILDKALTGPLEVVWDGAYSHTGLTIRANTVIRVLPGCGAILRPNSGKCLFINANATSSTIVDQNIYIVGAGTWNGNRSNGASGGSDPRFSAAGRFLFGMQFAGVRNLNIVGQNFIDCCTYAVMASNLDQFYFANLDIRTFTVAEGTINNTDGIHVIGPAKFGQILRITGFTNDDLVALNADDSNTYETGYINTFGPVTQGAITDVLIDDVCSDGGLFGVRLLSHISRMDRIMVRNIHGNYRGNALVIDDYFVSTAAVVAGPGGNFGSIIIDGVDIGITGTLTDTRFFCVMRVADQIESLTLRNLHRNKITTTRPLLMVQSTANIGVLTIDGVEVFEAASGDAATDVVSFVSGSAVGQLALRGAAWRQTGFTGTGHMLGGACAVGQLVASNYVGPAGSAVSRLLGFSVSGKSGDAFVPVTQIMQSDFTLMTNGTVLNGMAPNVINTEGNTYTGPTGAVISSGTLLVPGSGSTYVQENRTTYPVSSTKAFTLEAVFSITSGACIVNFRDDSQRNTTYNAMLAYIDTSVIAFAVVTAGVQATAFLNVSTTAWASSAYSTLSLTMAANNTMSVKVNGTVVATGVALTGSSWGVALGATGQVNFRSFKALIP